MWENIKSSGVKNPHIMHFVIEVGEGNLRRMAYLCNQACEITPSKRTELRERVSCKNCLRELDKIDQIEKARPKIEG